MKQIIIIALLVVIAFTYNGPYPRSKQSCQDQHVRGLFWDGQKCEVCANEFCYCTDYLGCTKCDDGYSMHKIEGLYEAKNKCYSCNNNTSGLSYAGEIKECCFHGYTNQLDYDKQNFENQSEIINFTKSHLEENNYLISRAISCKVFGIETSQPWDNTLDMELKKGSTWTKGVGQSRRYGSYCLYYKGCIAYNNYGQCFECAEGYYLDHHSGQSVCRDCPSNCTKCGADGQCSECAPHFFLKTQKTRISIEDDAKKYSYASHCEECDENCLCDGKIINTGTTKDEELKCNLGCINKHFLKTVGVDGAQDNCKEKCSDECETCEIKKVEDTTEKVCTKCYTDFPVNGSFYAPLNTKNQCLKCPSNCHACRLMPDGTQTTCLENKCDNGYYPSTTNKRTTCQSCNKNIEGKGNVLRCDSTKIITQCESNAGSSQTITYQDVHNNYDNQYHKVGEQETAVCQKNSFSCKKIKQNTSQGIDNVDCETCYEDQGFHLKTDKRECYQGLGQGCKKNSAAGQCGECIKMQQSKLKGSKFSKEQNYRLHNGSCVHCEDGYLSCETSDKLSNSTCQFGYYLDNTVCQQCTVDYCDECPGNICKSCAPRWTLWKINATGTEVSDYKCVQCSQNCLECNAEAKSSDRRICTECDQGYYLFQGTCYIKRINCARQKDNGDCQYCNFGYRVVDGKCLPAIDVTAGYINTEYGCGVNHRVRDDGHLLNREEFSDVYQPLSSKIVQFGVVILSVLALLL